MAMRSRTTFKKRQKELARQEKQRDKAAKRLERKLHKGTEEENLEPLDGPMLPDDFLQDETQDEALGDSDLHESPALVE